MAAHDCPICKRPAENDRAKNPNWPFCSRRCKVIDLGGWLDERYRVPADDQGDGDGSDGSPGSGPPVPPRREGDGNA